MFRQRADYASIAIALVNLGAVAHHQRDRDAARAYLSEALGLVRHYNMRRVLPGLLNNLAVLAVEEGDMAQARDLLAEALDGRGEQVNASDLVSSLKVGALAALANGKPAAAVRLLSAAHVLRESHTIALSPPDQADFATLLDRAKAAVESKEFSTAWSAGRRLSVAEMVAAACA